MTEGDSDIDWVEVLPGHQFRDGNGLYPVVTPEQMTALLHDARRELDPVDDTGRVYKSDEEEYEGPVGIPAGEAQLPDLGVQPAQPMGDVSVSPRESEEAVGDADQPTWSFRNSPPMKSRFIGWLLDHIPDLLSHAATFLLGAASVLFLLRRRINWSAVLNLPIE